MRYARTFLASLAVALGVGAAAAPGIPAAAPVAIEFDNRDWLIVIFDGDVII